MREANDKLKLQPVTVTPEDKSDALILRQHVADGTYGTREFSVSGSIGGLAFIVETDDRQIVLNMREAIINVLGQIYPNEQDDEKAGQ